MTVRAMKAGAVEFLPKPFRDQDLLDAIEQAIDRDPQARTGRAEVVEIRFRFKSLTPARTRSDGACCQRHPQQAKRHRTKV
jgi:FixJ family two-component response regulator